jgi:cellulose synthase/poly-beta-1,6-N-acetylglucosamine synthase-like glycosyltransferase
MQWLLLILIIPYIYVTLRIYGGLVKINPYLPVSSPDLFVSVIVACRNEEKNLPALLNYISEQDYNTDNFELIIIDDNSSDKTLSIASSFKKIRNLKALRNNGNGKKQAIRTGMAASSGNLIIATDADCQMGIKWIKTIASFYTENMPEMIICPVKLESSTGFFHRFQELEYLSLQGVTAGTAAGGNPVMCNGANLAFNREAYNRHSGNLHDEIPSGDDVFLLHSIKREPDNKIMWIESQEAIVTTKSPETIGSFIKQRVKWISKAGAYKDTFTRVLAIVTFAAILLQYFLLIAGIFRPDFLPVLLVAFLLKSIPDYLILQNTAARYGRKRLLGIFIPGQLIYPVYVVSVFFSYLFAKAR